MSIGEVEAGTNTEQMKVVVEAEDNKEMVNKSKANSKE